MSKKKVLGKRVGFVPGVSDALVRTSALLRPAQRLFWQEWQHGLSGAPVHIERIRALRELVRIDQSATGFVICVRREMIVNVKLSRRLDGFCKATNQAVNLLLSGLGSCNRIGASKPGKILPKAVPGNEGMKMLRRAKVVCIVIPAAHVRPRRRHSLALPKRLEERVFVEVQKQIMVMIELFAQQSFE